MLFLYLSPVIVYPGVCAALLYARGRFAIKKDRMPGFFIGLWPLFFIFSPLLAAIFGIAFVATRFDRLEDLGKQHRIRAIDRRRTI